VHFISLLEHLFSFSLSCHSNPPLISVIPLCPPQSLLRAIPPQIEAGAYLESDPAYVARSSRMRLAAATLARTGAALSSTGGLMSGMRVCVCCVRLSLSACLSVVGAGLSEVGS
jgi:hypothetical protein